MAHLQMKKQAPVGAALPAMRTRHVRLFNTQGNAGRTIFFTGLGFSENEHKIGYSLGANCWWGRSNDCTNPSRIFSNFSNFFMTLQVISNRLRGSRQNTHYLVKNALSCYTLFQVNIP